MSQKLTNKTYKALTGSINWNKMHFVESRGAWLYNLLQARYIEMINEIAIIVNSHKSTPVKILDIGCFPGAFGIILKKYFGNKIVLDGVGLGLSKEFRKEISGMSTYSNLYEVELDPENLQNKNDSIPTSLPLTKNEYYNVIIAGEVIEHLYSPIHFIKECHKYLTKEGVLLLTTPNISYFGNICRLIIGKTIHQTLENSHIFMRDDWRPHIRIYDKFELNKLFSDNGFKFVKVEFIDNKEDLREKLPFMIRLKMGLIRLFFLIPHFRNQYIGILKKN